jgi:hypothetical protein
VMVARPPIQVAPIDQIDREAATLRFSQDRFQAVRAVRQQQASDAAAGAQRFQH